MILNKIVEKKKETLKIQESLFPLSVLLAELHKAPKRPSFYNAIAANGLSIIGEIKRASPSKGILRKEINFEEVVEDYSSSVHCISVLTEEHFFYGDPVHLKKVSSMTKLPVLRKDFIIDPYQIYESRYLGASCVLLIASILDLNRLSSFNSLAQDLGLDTIIEVHTKEDIEKALYADAKIIGINNRNLQNFSVDLNKTLELRKYIPKEIKVVSESGINSNSHMNLLSKAEIDGVLIGESFMKATNIKDKAKELILAYEGAIS